MMNWQIPKTLNNFQGFLGLTGYYHKFVQNYGRIVALLTTLLKKDSFSWTSEETQYFQQLKEVMCKAPILVTPDFTRRTPSCIHKSSSQGKELKKSRL